MKCPYCGEQNSNRAVHCSLCGRRLDRARELKRERRILIYGVVLILVILAAGISAMYAVSQSLNSTVEDTTASKKVKIVTTPTPEPTQAPEETPSPTEEAPAVTETPETTQTPDPAAASESEPAAAPEEEKPEEFQIRLVDQSRTEEILAMGYQKAALSSASATSSLYQPGIDNSAYVLVDGTDYSSWQDGVDGPGIGESITLGFDREYRVRFIVLRLGNWYSDGWTDYFVRNNRPKQLLFNIGGKDFTVEFPDEMKEFCLEFSEEINASALQLTIVDVYPGTEFDDTCICEVDTYGY